MMDKVHGIQATSLTMNDRFSILSGYPLPVVPDRPPSRQMNRTPARFINHGISAKNNQLFIDSLARRLERKAKIAALRQRLGLPQPMNNNRRNDLYFGGGMRRSNSFGNLSQASFGNRSWNGTSNLSRSASFSNLSQLGQVRWRRGYRRRGAPNWRFRGQFRGNQQGQYVMGFRRGNWIQYRGQRRGRGNGNMGGMRRNQQQFQQYQQRSQQYRQHQQPIPTREELDHQLDEYMASSRLTLDKQLEEYMKMAEMETE